MGENLVFRPLIKGERFSVIIKIIVSLFLIGSSSFSLFAHQISPIFSYSPSDYSAGNQNWMIDQMATEEIIIANNDGLLIFNGAQWKLHGEDLGLVVRSVKAIGEKLYTGSYMDFGVWSKQENGNFEYQSLLRERDSTVKYDEQFWNILELDNNILFQSLNKLYLYNPLKDKTELIDVPDGVNKVFKLGKIIYFQSFKKDIYKLVNGQVDLFVEGSKMPDSEVIKMFNTEEGIKFIAKEEGFFSVKSGEVEKWVIQSEELFDIGDVFSAIRLRNGSYVLGTITRGVYILNADGKITMHVNQLTGLNNNTVLSLYEDQQQNLWLGLDNGVSVINLQSPFEEYVDRAGILGTIYTSIVHGGYLYIGTNQGLFYRPIDDDGDFKLIKNSNGQVWTLFNKGDDLFCGHNLGTFIVDEFNMTRISDQLGTWKFEDIPGKDDLLFQGNYEGLHLIEKSNSSWSYKNSVDGVSFSMRQYDFVDDHLFYFHPSMGLYKLKLSESLKLESEAQLIKETIHGMIASQVVVNGDLYFHDAEGLFRYDKKKDSLIVVNIPIGIKDWADQSIPTLVENQDSAFWLIYENGLIMAVPDDAGNIQWTNEVHLDPQLFKNKDEFENITNIKDKKYLIGLTNGYLIVDFNKFNYLNTSHQVNISSIKKFRTEEAPEVISLEEVSEFKTWERNFTFENNVPNIIKYQPILYQYYLEGDMLSWSDWVVDPSITFYKLKPGKYTYHVRAKLGNHLTENTATYSFKIKEHWYLSSIAISVYFLLLLLLSFMINYFYRSYYRKRQQMILEKNQKELNFVKLQSDQELMKVKNEQLSSEIESKNKELAVTTMSLVKKNEFLIEIKEQLQKAKDIKDFNANVLIKSVNKEIENEESWELLKGAFENVDKDFIKKIKGIHPKLTPNDLKLCTYLRLNLNSKEIASLLNISVRSMETKRYRLRKKMDLDHTTNLVEHILSI